MSKITIFTPTYNRGHLLPNLYNSLLNQTCKNFEWLIIDDESNDNTEVIVNKIIEKNDSFEIRYYKQKHGGKHRAINKALDIAKGDYFFIVDSDDQLTRDAVELAYKWIEDTCHNSKIAGVAGLRSHMNGDVIGDKLSIENDSWIECSNFDRERNHLLGDKAEIYKTELLKKNKFPEFDNEFFVTEAVMWDKVAALGYQVRWYNTIIYLCEYLDNGLSKSGANSLNGYINNYMGFSYYVRQRIRYTYLENNLRLILDYIRVSKIKKISFIKIVHNIGLSKYEFIKLIANIPFHYISKKIGGNNKHE
ncbi:glycosyltransferase family 2 protein [Thomasclavelia spiroformis]|uniref:glycosyltransferase family 2 protein n=1 Tax=Thomasclavelia spiroformis TaxID=29348 RepID=UPI0024B03D37|nr:glycosyltransferase family 2 protein [Thomasclavelia spiroformis]